MSERTKHLFEFNAIKIAVAAKAEAEYHTKRVDYWKAEYDKAARKAFGIKEQ